MLNYFFKLFIFCNCMNLGIRTIVYFHDYFIRLTVDVAVIYK